VTYGRGFEGPIWEKQGFSRNCIFPDWGEKPPSDGLPF